MKNITKKAFFAPLVGIALIGAIVFMACPNGDETFTVTFDLEGGAYSIPGPGGTANPVVTVAKGEKIPTADYPSGVTRTISINAVPSVEGLYKEGGTQSANGWLKPGSTTETWDLTKDTVSGNITLKPNWSALVPLPIDQSTGDNFVSKSVNYIQNLANLADGDKYILVLSNDVSVAGPVTLNITNTNLRIVGTKQVTITASNGERLFIVGKSGTNYDSKISLTLGNNITLQREATVTTKLALVQVRNDAIFTMLTGSKITGNKSNADFSEEDSTYGLGAAVHVGIGYALSGQWSYLGRGGTFNLEGGEITGNSATGTNNGVVGGLYADSTANVNLNSGSITGNTSGNATTKNVYVTHTVILTLKGAPVIGDITLNANSATQTGSIVLSNYTGSTPLTTLHLRGADATAATATGFWTPTTARTILKGPSDSVVTAADVGKFTLGSFLNAGTTATSISSTHQLSTTGTDTGKLVRKQ